MFLKKIILSLAFSILTLANAQAVICNLCNQEILQEDTTTNCEECDEVFHEKCFLDLVQNRAKERHLISFLCPKCQDISDQNEEQEEVNDHHYLPHSVQVQARATTSSPKHSPKIARMRKENPNSPKCNRKFYSLDTE